jgi:chemotaxis protein CheD
MLSPNGVALAHTFLPQTHKMDYDDGVIASRAVPAMLEQLGDVYGAVLVGGAQMFRGINSSQIGQRNIQSALLALAHGDVKLLAQEVAGESGRSVQVEYENGEVIIRVRKVGQPWQEIIVSEAAKHAA